MPRLTTLGWSLPELGRRPKAIYTALSALAVLHRLHGHDHAATAAASEALRLHVAASPRRLSNRVDPRADVAAAAAACCLVLAGGAAAAGDGEDAARLLGHAEALRAQVGLPMLALLADDAAEVRRVASGLIGEDAFLDEFEIGAAGRLDHEVALRR